MTTAGPGTLGLPERTGARARGARDPPRPGACRGAGGGASAAPARSSRSAGACSDRGGAARGARSRGPGHPRWCWPASPSQRLLQRRPGLLRWVHRSAQHRFAARCRGAGRTRWRRSSAVPADDAPEELLRRLRRFKARQALRLAARDLWLGAPMEALGREQTGAGRGAAPRGAAAALEAPLRRRYGAPVAARASCVLGLGKLGGEDLNWSSDIDLVYVHRGDGTTSGGTRRVALPTVTYYTRLAEALTRAMSTVTADGFCYRVDLNLRPQGRGGRGGDLAAVDAAVLRAARPHLGARRADQGAAGGRRPRAGTGAARGARALRLAAERWTSAAVEALRDLKMQIDLREHRPRERREARAGRHPRGGVLRRRAAAAPRRTESGAARVRSTQRALRRLVEAGLLSQADADRLLEAYVFLRRVENRLQMVRRAADAGAASPGAGAATGWRARSGFADCGRVRGGAGSPPELRARRPSSVLLGQDGARGAAARADLVVALDDGRWRTARGAEALARRGFDDPVRPRWRRCSGSGGCSGPPGSRKARASGIALQLLPGRARSPDPDQALLLPRRVRRRRSRSPQGYLRLLHQRPGGGAAAARPLRTERVPQRRAAPDPGAAGPAGVLGRGGAAQAAGANPHRAGRAGGTRHRRSGAAARGAAPLQERGGAAGRPRRHRRGARGARGGAPAHRAGRRRCSTTPSSSLASTRALAGACRACGTGGGRRWRCSEWASSAAASSATTRTSICSSSTGRAPTRRRRADPPDASATTSTSRGWCSGSCRSCTLQYREGRLYQVDTRLRPSGNQGPLVVSEEALLEHHARRAQLWERQALVKARGGGGRRGLRGAAPRQRARSAHLGASAARGRRRRRSTGSACGWSGRWPASPRSS